MLLQLSESKPSHRKLDRNHKQHLLPELCEATPVFLKSVTNMQVSAKDSTPLCYSKKNRYSANIRGRIVGRIVGRYSTRGQVEYLKLTLIFDIRLVIK